MHYFYYDTTLYTLYPATCPSRRRNYATEWWGSQMLYPLKKKKEGLDFVNHNEDCPTLTQ